MINIHRTCSLSMLSGYSRCIPIHFTGLNSQYVLPIYFKLYGLNKVSIMFGGVEPWNNFVRDQQLEQNVEAYKNGKTAQPHQGNFKAKWVPKIIVTFDDAIANFGARDSNSFDIVDAQTTEVRLKTTM